METHGTETSSSCADVRNYWDFTKHKGIWRSSSLAQCGYAEIDKQCLLAWLLQVYSFCCFHSSLGHRKLDVFGNLGLGLCLFSLRCIIWSFILYNVASSLGELPESKNKMLSLLKLFNSLLFPAQRNLRTVSHLQKIFKLYSLQ